MLKLLTGEEYIFLAGIATTKADSYFMQMEHRIPILPSKFGGSFINCASYEEYFTK